MADANGDGGSSESGVVGVRGVGLADVLDGFRGKHPEILSTWRSPGNNIEVCDLPFQQNLRRRGVNTFFLTENNTLNETPPTPQTLPVLNHTIEGWQGQGSERR